MAERLAQSSLKNVATEVLSWARLDQNKLFAQTGHTNSLPFTSTV
jgi:hypothetical protein